MHFHITICILCFPHILWVVDGTNLVIGEIYFCDAKAPQELYDGDQSGMSHITHTCKKSDLSITLNTNYYVSHVILYGVEGNKDNQLDFFNVQIEDERRESENCGMYLGKTKVRGTELQMRLNCKPRTRKAFFVQIYFNAEAEIFLSEVEVHSVGPLYLNIPLIYRGCFQISEPIRKQAKDWERCLTICRDLNILLTALKGNTCGCVHDTSKITELPGSHCNKKCIDGVRNCGGKEAYSVYLSYVPLPYAKACIRYDQDIPDYSYMTVASCLERCVDYELASLRAETKCKCLDTDNELSNLMAADWPEGNDLERCRRECPDDPEMFCATHGFITVYSTCRYRHNSSQRAHMNCNELLHCKDGYDMHGVCKGGCQEGYVGEHCLERVTDICDFDPCDLKNSYCKSLNDSYDCLCLEGFAMINYTCKAIESAFLNILVMLVVTMCMLMLFVAFFLCMSMLQK